MYKCIRIYIYIYICSIIRRNNNTSLTCKLAVPYTNPGMIPPPSPPSFQCPGGPSPPALKPGPGPVGHVTLDHPRPWIVTVLCALAENSNPSLCYAGQSNTSENQTVFECKFEPEYPQNERKHPQTSAQSRKDSILLADHMVCDLDLRVALETCSGTCKRTL